MLQNLPTHPLKSIWMLLCGRCNGEKRQGWAHGAPSSWWGQSNITAQCVATSPTEGLGLCSRRLAGTLSQIFSQRKEVTFRHLARAREMPNNVSI